MVVTASNDATARIWDVANGKVIAVLRGHKYFVRSAAFSPDGTRVVTNPADDTARIWDVPSGKEVAALRGHESGLNSATFSRDGTRVVTASLDKTARIWDAGSGAEIVVLHGHEGFVLSADFSPDGSRIVTASDNTARIWASDLYVLSAEGLFLESCKRLAGISKFTRDEMRLANYPESLAEIDVCKDNHRP